MTHRTFIAWIAAGVILLALEDLVITGAYLGVWRLPLVSRVGPRSPGTP